MKLKNLTPLAACLILSGCVVGAAVDLAATTVVTAGKLAVKGTGAVINAAIPDGDDKKKKDKKKQEKAQQPETQQVPPPPYAPAHTRYITVDADGNVVEERDAP
jgi:hypothetical protein